MENEFSVSHALRDLPQVSRHHEDNETKQCWLHEDFRIKKECTYCTEFEKVSFHRTSLPTLKLHKPMMSNFWHLLDTLTEMDDCDSLIPNA